MKYGILVIPVHLDQFHLGLCDIEVVEHLLNVVVIFQRFDEFHYTTKMRIA